MAQTLVLRQVQKGKSGRVHLAVPGDTGAAVRTLCNKRFETGDYREVDAEADCQVCRKRRSDPALVSSAFFEGDMGSHLLEMAVEQAKAGRARRDAEARVATGRSKAREPSTGAGGGRRAAPAAKAKLAVVPEPEQPGRLGDLELSGLKKVADHVYQSPGGVIIRGRRRGKDWEVAEVVFDGDIQVKRTGSGEVRLKIGDVVIDYSVGADGLSALYRTLDRS